jgi:hypothetical protein
MLAQSALFNAIGAARGWRLECPSIAGVAGSRSNLRPCGQPDWSDRFQFVEQRQRLGAVASLAAAPFYAIKKRN